MLGSIAFAGSDITRTTATGHMYRSEARRPTRPTAASSTHRSWCCQAVGDTTTATHPVTAIASRNCPSRAYRTARRSPRTATAAPSAR
ncbi:hypothetical protein B0E37_01317 [Streptomyces sp. MH192]|nr:hypothetical protein [Streptomyces sp. MH192]MCF0103582.1 hypothetical protein [Streptomyces sp. MH191]